MNKDVKRIGLARVQIALLLLVVLIEGVLWLRAEQRLRESEQATAVAARRTTALADARASGRLGGGHVTGSAQRADR
jgi:hypothetical protein